MEEGLARIIDPDAMFAVLRGRARIAWQSWRPFASYSAIQCKGMACRAHRTQPVEVRSRPQMATGKSRDRNSLPLTE